MVEFLDRVGCLREGVVDDFDALVLVLLSEVANSICFLVFGPCFLDGFGFHGFARLVPTSTSALGKYGKYMLPLKDRILEKFDFGRAMSDFPMIFPSNNSAVVLEVFTNF